MPYDNLHYSRRAMDLPVPVPRDELRAASAEAAAAAERALHASHLASRGWASVDRARGAVAANSALDTAITLSYAGSLTPCATDPADLHGDFAASGLAQAAAEKALVDADAGHAQLVLEAMVAMNEAKQAEARKIAAIADVMKATAVSMLPQLRDAEALAGRLRASIAGYMNCWAINDGEAFKPVPVEVSVVFKEPQGGPLMALASLNWQQAAARWQEYRTELATDPDAAPPAALG